MTITEADVPRVAAAAKDAANIIDALGYWPAAWDNPELVERVERCAENAERLLALELEVAAWAAEDLTLNPPARVTSRQSGSVTLNGGSFVYVAYGAHGEVLYVGVTDNLFGRLSSHNRSPWWSQADRIQWTEWPDRLTALKREADLIRLHCPPFNTSGNPDRKARR